MMYMIYALVGLAGGVLTGMAGLTAAMVVTPMLCAVCGWSGYDAVTLSLIANVPSALVTCYTFYKNGNLDLKRGAHVALAAFLGKTLKFALALACVLYVLPWIGNVLPEGFPLIHDLLALMNGLINQ